MKRFVKRTGAFLVALCIIASLMPSFAFAAVDGEVTIDFTTAEIKYYHKNSGQLEQTYPKDIKGTDFVTVKDETTTTTSNQTARNFGSPKLIFVQTNDKPWLSDSGAMERWTVEIDMKTTKPGWYDVSLVGGKWSAGTSWYVYADEQYAGYYDCYDSTLTGNPSVDSAKKLNTLYLTPDENGKVKVMFALAELKSSYPRLLVQSIILTPTTEPDFSTALIDSQVEIPENVTVGTEIPY